MNKIIFLLSTLCVASVFANSESTIGAIELVLNGQDSFGRIEGKVAKKLYETLSVPAKNDSEGAGPAVFFKQGKSYACHAVAINTNDPKPENVTDHACNFSIDPSSGSIEYF